MKKYLCYYCENHSDSFQCTIDHLVLYHRDKCLKYRELELNGASGTASYRTKTHKDITPSDGDIVVTADNKVGIQLKDRSKGKLQDKQTITMGIWNELVQLTSTKQQVYQIIKTEQDYEERRLESSKWISTTIIGVYQELAKIEGFKLLQSYIQGQNEEGIQMSMKPPILTRVTSSRTGNFESSFTVSMCIETAKDKPLPEPSNQAVYIERFPAMHVFAKSVEGVPSDEKWLFQARKLAESLQSKENIRTDMYFTATHENPLQLICKDSEIWLIKYENEGAIVPFAKQNTINIGHHQITLPTIVVKVLALVMSYISFLIALVKICFNFATFARANSDALIRTVQSTAQSLAEKNSIARIGYTVTAFGIRRCLSVMKWFNKRANNWL